MSSLVSLGADKYMHFSLGVVISVAIFGVASIFTAKFTASVIVVLSITAIGAIKELIDKFNDGAVERNDFYATVLGGVSPMLAVWLVLI